MKIFNEDPWVSRSLRELGEYSDSELTYLKVFLGLLSLHSGPVDIVEAGAYIGDLTLPLSKVCRKIYAFEPQVEVREVLEWNLATNHISNVEVLPFGLGDKPMTMYYSSVPPIEGAGGTMMDSKGDVAVEIRTLDSFGLTPAFIKADIEGMEPAFLVGALETLQRTRCPLFMEFDTVMQQGLEQLPEILGRLGYDVTKFFFPMYNTQNFNHAPNPFGLTVSKMLLAVPPVGAVLG